MLELGEKIHFGKGPKIEKKPGKNVDRGLPLCKLAIERNRTTTPVAQLEKIFQFEILADTWRRPLAWLLKILQQEFLKHHLGGGKKPPGPWAYLSLEFFLGFY